MIREKRYTILLVWFYIVAIILMVIGTRYDLQFSIKVFNPNSTIGKITDYFGQFPYFAIWGPAGTILFLSRHSLQEETEIINRIFSSITPITNTKTRSYNLFNTINTIITTAGFFALSIIGWRKLIANVGKYIMLITTGEKCENDLVYYILAFIIFFVAYFALKDINKDTLYRLEALSIFGILFGIVYLILIECKEITSRARFREMIAYSNGILNDGKSFEKSSEITKEMVSTSDFSYYSKWYQIGIQNEHLNNSDSFPSGHTAGAMAIFLLTLSRRFFPFIKDREKSIFMLSSLYVIIVALGRIVIGAHYITDTVFSAIIMFTFILIFDAILKRLINIDALPTKSY